MRKRELTEFGKEVKFELMCRNETQTWLIQRLRENTDMYVDSSILYKVMTGQVNSRALESNIRAVLNLPTKAS